MPGARGRGASRFDRLYGHNPSVLTRIAPNDCDCVQRVVATCGESPMWSVREQALYWTDNLGGRIYRLEPESGSDQCAL